MTSTYKLLRQVTRIVASERHDSRYPAVAVRFGARLDEVCEAGAISPRERDSLWRILDVDAAIAQALARVTPSETETRSCRST
jgi:hypothetical protein